MSLLRRTCLIALSSSCLLSAAELKVADLRVGFGILPEDFDFTVSNDTASISDSDTFDDSYRLAVSGRFSPVQLESPFGFIYGGELYYGFNSYVDGDYNVLGVTGTLGAGYAINDDFHVEGTAFLGPGLSTLDLDLGGGERFEASGVQLEYGLRAGGYLAVHRNVVLGANAEYRWTTVELSDNDLDIDWDTDGFALTLEVAYRFRGENQTFE
jgi:hypothetical protein